MLINEFLGLKVLDKNASEVGTVSDIDFNPLEGTCDKIIISLNNGFFSKDKVEVTFSDIATIGDYLILSSELPQEEEVEEVKEVSIEIDDEEE